MRRPDRGITVTPFGWWYAARQRLVAHLEGKCRVDNGD